MYLYFQHVQNIALLFYVQNVQIARATMSYIMQKSPRPQRQPKSSPTPVLLPSTCPTPPDGHSSSTTKWEKYFIQIESTIEKGFDDQQQQASDALNLHLNEMQQLRNDKETFDKTIASFETQLSAAKGEAVQWRDKCAKLEKTNSRLRAKRDMQKQCADNIVDQIVGVFGHKRKASNSLAAMVKEIDSILDTDSNESAADDDRTNEDNGDSGMCKQSDSGERFHGDKDYRVHLSTHAAIGEKSYSI